MPAPMLTIQYLENSPALAQLDPQLVVDKLRLAYARLPFTHLLIGWHLPASVLEACRREAESLGVRFLRWQPLLTSDQVFVPQPGWLTVGLTGQVVCGQHASPEFTFACPNHPAVQEQVLRHLESLVHAELYQGFFLDRLRFPSPAADPVRHLACFCEHCHRKAADLGLDLEELRRGIQDGLRDDHGRMALVEALLTSVPGNIQSAPNQPLAQFLAFRSKSITDFLDLVAQPIRQSHLELGLDCFSPSLANLVGQDLHALSPSAGWVKLMTYVHTFAPAGLPFELAGLVHYLTSSTTLGETQSLHLVGQFAGLPMPANLQSLQAQGLPSHTLELELSRGMALCSAPVLAGIELVDLPGITSQNPTSLQADLAALNPLKPAGLALSWDLLHFSLPWLDVVRRVYFENALI